MKPSQVCLRLLVTSFWSLQPCSRWSVLMRRELRKSSPWPWWRQQEALRTCVSRSVGLFITFFLCLWGWWRCVTSGRLPAWSRCQWKSASVSRDSTGHLLSSHQYRSSRQACSTARGVIFDSSPAFNTNLPMRPGNKLSVSWFMTFLTDSGKIVRIQDCLSNIMVTLHTTYLATLAKVKSKLAAKYLQD